MAASTKLSPFLLCRLSKRRLLISRHLSSPPRNHDSAISRKNLNPSSLIDVLNSDPDPVSAVDLFRRASRQRSFRHTPETYAHLVSKLGLAGKSQEMEEFLKEMVKFHCPPSGIESSFQLLVESFCRNRRPREALKVFEIASRAKFRLSISACNGLMSALVEEKSSLDVVVFVYKEMVKAGIFPNVDSLNCLIRVLVENGQMELALDQFERMEKKNCRPNSLTFEIVIGGLCCCGRVDEAVRVWNRMVEIGCSRDCSFYTSIIPWFCRVHRLNEASKLFKLMKSDGFSPDLYLYIILIRYLSEELRMDDAIEVFEEMSESGFTPVTCMHVDIVNAYCKVGEFGEAIRFLEENDVSDVQPYNALLQGLCDRGRIQEGIIYLKQIQEIGISDGHSWNILVDCLCEKGDVGKAFEVLGRMIVSSFSPDGSTYSAFITGFCKMGSYGSALDWFWQGLVRDMSFDSESCSELIKGLCHEQKVQEAVEVFYLIASKGSTVNTNALDILIQGLCLGGKVNEAIKLHSVALCNGTMSTSYTYEIVSLALLDLNRQKDMLPLLSQMLVEGCPLTSRTYRILVCALCVESTCWTAASLFNQMVQDLLIPDTETLEKLVYGAFKCSQLHLVVHSLDKVIEGGGLTSPTVCNMIICGLLKEGCEDEARKFLDWMLEKGWVPDSNTHGLLVGSVDVEGRDGADKVDEDGDGVSSILSEGLGDSS